MNHPDPDQIFCSECGQQVPKEFYERLVHGDSVFCEFCGARIKAKMSLQTNLTRATPQSPKLKSRPPRTLVSARAAELKSDISAPNLDEVLSAHVGQRAEPVGSQTQKTAAPGLRPPDGVDKGIQAFHRWTLPLGVFILLIAAPLSIIEDAMNPIRVTTHVAGVFCALGALSADKRFYNLVSQRDYSFRGIDLILWGFIGCFGFGVGSLALAKGLLILTQTIHAQEEYPRLSKNQWLHVVISRVNANSASAGAVIWIATVSLAITMYVTQPFPPSGAAIAFLVISFVIVILDGGYFTRKLKQNARNRQSLELGIFMLGAGILGSFHFAVGVPLMIKGLAVVLLSGAGPEARAAPVSMPVSAPAPLQAPVTPETSVPSPFAPLQESPLVTVKISPPKPTPRPEVAHPTPTPLPAPPAGAGQPAEKMLPAAPAPAPAGDFEHQAAIQNYLNRIYTVVSSKIRDRVQKLDVPDSEKKEVLDGLLLLTPQEQERFLAELEELARRLMPEIVGRILRLNLTKEQNEALISQLEYLSDQEQIEFLAELERARAA